MSEKLIRWFDTHWKPQGNQAELAAKLDISEPYLSLLLSGKKPWTLELALKLETISNGLVLPRDLMEVA